MGNNELIDDEIKAIFALFFDESPIEQKIIDTSRGEDDFRNAVIISTQAGNRYVLMITENDFTSPEKIRVWKRTIEEYRNLGYYCPLIYNDKNDSYPMVSYKGHNCIVYAEEYSKYMSLENRENANKNGEDIDTSAYIEDIWTMTAKVGARNFDYADFPSAYCLFETFCPSDKTDEVMENALDWKKMPLRFRRYIQSELKQSGAVGTKTERSFCLYTKSCQPQYFRQILIQQIFLLMTVVYSREFMISTFAVGMFS